MWQELKFERNHCAIHSSIRSRDLLWLHLCSSTLNYKSKKMTTFSNTVAYSSLNIYETLMDAIDWKLTEQSLFGRIAYWKHMVHGSDSKQLQTSLSISSCVKAVTFTKRFHNAGKSPYLKDGWSLSTYSPNWIKCIGRRRFLTATTTSMQQVRTWTQVHF